MATLSGCDVVPTDVPLSGLGIARQRAAKDGMDGRCNVLAADEKRLLSLSGPPYPDA